MKIFTPFLEGSRGRESELIGLSGRRGVVGGDAGAAEQEAGTDDRGSGEDAGCIKEEGCNAF